MKPEEEKAYHLVIQICYLKINKAQKAYREIKSRKLGLTDDETQGYLQKKAIQLARIMQFYYPVIIENKKKLKLATWGPDQKVLHGINKMLQNIN